MKNKIEKPKVFISYAWADKEYENLVLEFASQLMSVGIDVVLDKWDLSEGNDTYAFMEKCVNDSTITNVLMLLDPVYAQKANAHKGGVGTETQIISAKVYKEVNQDKFIPIVMKKDDDGNICKPTYLESRLHFDLTNEEDYDDTFQRLVKKLYGIDTYIKPDLGNEPDWVEKSIESNPKKTIHYDSVKKNKPESEKVLDYKNFLEELSQQMIDFSNQGLDLQKQNYIEIYKQNESIKNEYFKVLKNAYYVKSSNKLLSEFFEQVTNGIHQNYGPRCSVIMILIHELFLYTIAYFLKHNDYETAGYFLGKTYFNIRNNHTQNHADCFHMFYSGSEQGYFDKAVNQRDNKQYHTGTGQYWIETVNTEICSKEQFVFADIICFNVSVFGNIEDTRQYWFPITYIYDAKSKLFNTIVNKLVSKECLEYVLPLFSYEKTEEFVSKVKEFVNCKNNNDFHMYTYPGCFEYAPLLTYKIEADDIAKYR